MSNYFFKFYFIIFSILILSLITSCCITGKLNLSQKEENIKEELILKNKKNAVVLIQNKINFSLTSTLTNNVVLSDKLNVSGTGFFIKEELHYNIIITVAHVCSFKLHKSMYIDNIFHTNPNMFTYSENNKILINSVFGEEPGTVIAIDYDKDLCMLITLPISNNLINISDNAPLYGQKFYSLGYPKGFWDTDYLPIFSGYYSGKYYKSDSFSIPTHFGCSGSPILNNTGELVGITKGFLDFNNVTLSPLYADIKYFISKKLTEDEVNNYLLKLWEQKLELN